VSIDDFHDARVCPWLMAIIFGLGLVLARDRLAKAKEGGESASGPRRRAAAARVAITTKAARLRATCSDAFYTEHRQCGELEADIEEAMVWIACDCGARIVRRSRETCRDRRLGERLLTARNIPSATEPADLESAGRS
jgi:hypothetical protein